MIVWLDCVVDCASLREMIRLALVLFVVSCVNSRVLEIPADVLMVSIPSDTAMEFAAKNDRMEPTSYQCENCDAKDYAEKMKIGAQRVEKVQNMPTQKLSRSKSTVKPSKATITRRASESDLAKRGAMEALEAMPEF